MVYKFGVQPLQSSGSSQNESPKMYQSKLGLSMGKGFNNQPQARSWVNWKKALTCFVLLNSPIPSEKDLGDLRVKLTAETNEGQAINKTQFIGVHFWFDRYEGKPDSQL
mmetsp:Transcript_21954/g.34100  ORF Transcript_21954/g.34100 Transcript_21954/m.34100 type:complete len:109 (+) Transcript_21954:1463-1789(+)